MGSNPVPVQVRTWPPTSRWPMKLQAASYLGVLHHDRGRRKGWDRR